LSAERQNTNVFIKLDIHYITVSGYVLVLSHIVPHKLIIVPHLVCLMVVTLFWCVWKRSFKYCVLQRGLLVYGTADCV